MDEIGRGNDGILADEEEVFSDVSSGGPLMSRLHCNHNAQGEIQALLSEL